MRIMFTVRSEKETIHLSRGNVAVRAIKSTGNTQIRSIDYVVEVKSSDVDVINAIESDDDLETEIISVQEVVSSSEVDEEVLAGGIFGGQDEEISGEGSGSTNNTTQEMVDLLAAQMQMQQVQNQNQKAAVNEKALRMFRKMIDGK